VCRCPSVVGDGACPDVEALTQQAISGHFRSPICCADILAWDFQRLYSSEILKLRSLCSSVNLDKVFQQSITKNIHAHFYTQEEVVNEYV